MLFTFGLRPSEAIGLQWKDIDLDKQTITISESLNRSDEGSRRIRKTIETSHGVSGERD